MADDLTARLQQAIQHRIAGEYDAAIPLLKGVIAASPASADAYHELGLIFSYQVADDCIPTLEKAVSLAPDNTKYLLDLGKAHAMFGDYEQAAPVLEKILQIDPFNMEAMQNLDYMRPFL